MNLFERRCPMPRQRRRAVPVAAWLRAGVLVAALAASGSGPGAVVAPPSGTSPKPPSAPTPSPPASSPPTAAAAGSGSIGAVAGTNDAWRIGGPLPLYQVEITPADLRALGASAFSNETRPIRFLSQGKAYEGARIRHRGEWARGWPKRPLKIFFDPDDRFHGHKSINLNSGWRDPAFVREALAYHVFGTCGVPSPRARMVRVDFNGAFRGLYVEVEQPDRTLLERHGLKGATLFKTSSPQNMADERDLGDEANFGRHYTNESKKDGGLKPLQEFCAGLARAKDVQAYLEQHLDVERYVGYLVATTLLQHWDGYTKNHLLVFDGEGRRKWFAMPWDLDRTLGDHWDQRFDAFDLPILLGTRRVPSIIGWNRLQDRFLGVPAFRARFKARLAKALENEFTPGKLFPLLDRWEASLTATAALDRKRWPSPAGDLHSGMVELKQFIQARRAFLLRELVQL